MSTIANRNDVEKNGLANRGTAAHADAPHVGPASGAPRGRAVYDPDADPTSWVPRAPGHRLGNPGPLGLTMFAGTTFVLSLINLQTAKVATPNIVVGMAVFVGGLVQLLAGMWEFAAGNTFGATAFSGYGAFWLSYALILIPGTGILTSYGDNADELAKAISFFLFSWFIFTFLMFISALRRNLGFVILLGLLDITFLLLAIGNYMGENATIIKAGGGFGIVTAFVAYYCAAAEILRPDDSLFTLPLGNLRKRVD